MAREACPVERGMSPAERGDVQMTRETYAAGVAAERARVAAHLHTWVASIRSRQPNECATIVWAVLESFAEELEGKTAEAVQP